MTTTLAASAAAIPSVERAVALAREARLLGSTAAILGWDQETMMPGGGLEHRSRQLAQLARLEHGMATDARLGEALAAAGDAVRALPEGLQATLVTGGLPLSGRQRIRLLVARALVLRPRLLLVDELLDGLDEATFEQLRGALCDPSIGWTVVVATRDPRVARRLGRTIEMQGPVPGMEVGK